MYFEVRVCFCVERTAFACGIETKLTTGTCTYCPPATTSSLAAVCFWEGKSRNLIVTPDSIPLALCGEAEELWGLTPAGKEPRQKGRASAIHLARASDQMMSFLCGFGRLTAWVSENLYSLDALSAKRPSPNRHMAYGIDEQTKHPPTASPCSLIRRRTRQGGNIDRHVSMGQPPQFTRSASVLEEDVGTGFETAVFGTVIARRPRYGATSATCQPMRAVRLLWTRIQPGQSQPRLS